ncbi:MAG TPA: TlpA disulfide reductase family protein [Stellaceae bacterium]|jgi:thiol-disulfide isomerase/thioredoxin|nr:TlpA disulfide reductase family protein [Stellaceae bacterium]
MTVGTKITIRALTVLLILCGAALLVVSLRPARLEKMPQAPAPSLAEGGAGPNLGQFTALPAPLPAPAVAFTTRDGTQKQLADFKGKLVLVNLWATWCGPCVEEMPSLDRLQAKLGDKLTVLAISEDRQGETVVAPFLQKNAIQHLAIFLDPQSAATSALGAQGLPTSYLIARDGTIVGKEEGGATWDSSEMIARLQPYIDGK